MPNRKVKTNKTTHVMREQYISVSELKAAVWEVPGMKDVILAEDAARQAAIFVRHVRESAGLSQVDLAHRVGVTQARISKVESGTGSRGVSIEILARIAAACGGQLFLGVEPPKRAA